MTKLLLILFCAAALSVHSASAQNASAVTQEPIPDEETNPARIKLENSLLDAVAQLDAGNPGGARVILDSLEQTGPADGAVQTAPCSIISAYAASHCGISQVP